MKRHQADRSDVLREKATAILQIPVWRVARRSCNDQVKRNPQPKKMASEPTLTSHFKRNPRRRPGRDRGWEDATGPWYITAGVIVIPAHIAGQLFFTA